MQRFLDIILCLMALLILSPFLILTILILRLTAEGEVFYIQPRVGLEGKLFGVYKFATMLKNSEKMGTGLITTKGDPRVFPVGRFLRKTKLNEIPQLFNILLGDMSFVGPRPQVQKHFDVFPAHVKKELVKMKPGLTGVGSIFFRDEETILEKNKHLSYDECYSQLIAPYKGELELWYAKNNSPLLYVLLIAITAWVVVFSESKLPSKLLKGLPTPPPELTF
jgi:lipopolysaccharide/colanic/teichoic acid biosynthesis glycosyltransferase